MTNSDKAHGTRRGWLKSGNTPGDFTIASRCGAKTRGGTVCQCPAMPNGRCRLHGGLSTGPKTAEGIDRIREAVTTHGRRTKDADLQRAEFRRLISNARESLEWLNGKHKV